MRFKEIKHKEVERKLQGDIRMEKSFSSIKPESMTAEEAEEFWDSFWKDMERSDEEN